MTGKSFHHAYDITITVPEDVASRDAIRDPTTLQQLYATHGRYRQAEFTLLKVCTQLS